VDAAKAPEAEQKVWNEYSTSLDQHEDGHVAINTQGATEIGNAMADAAAPVQANGKTEREAIENAKAGVNAEVQQARETAQQAVQKRNQEYDQRTDHGRKKPEDK
jgi:predicted secreted Zn-dependent protease